MVSLIDIDQVSQPFPLYLDGVHYSPAMNEWLASRISKSIKLKRTLFKKRNSGFEGTATPGQELLNPNNYPLF